MKRFWLPPQKGTGPGPLIQSPTKLVIRGVETGTPLYRSVAQKFDGRLKQFHGKQQQMYSLSNNPIARGHIDWGDARATYTNIAGQEILELEVDARLLAELQRTAEDYWLWALIEIVVPNISTSDTTRARAKAYRRIPGPAERTQKFGGFAYDDGEVYAPESRTYWSDGMNPFVMSYPPQDVEPIEVVAETAGCTQTISLQLDLRPIPKTTVVVDLYAYLEPVISSEEVQVGWERDFFELDIDDTIIAGPILYSEWEHADAGRAYRYNVTGRGYVDPNSAFAPHEAYIPGYAFVPNDPLSELRQTAPAEPMEVDPSTGGPGSGAYEYDPTYHGESGLLLQQTVDTLVLVSTGPTKYNVKHSVMTWTINPIMGSMAVWSTASRNAEVRAVGGYGHLDWTVSDHQAPDAEWWQWEVRPAYPRRLQTGIVGHVPISTYDPDADELFRLLGSVTIDPVYKSITFSPA